MYPIKSPKKLIEVALPLDAINVAAAREKSIRHGHPSTLHLWWARRPLAAARAVIFAQMVNDPGFQQGDGFRYGVNKEKAALERERLFKIIEDLVKWENTDNEEVLERARVEIRRSWREVCELNKNHPQAAELFNPDKLPAFHDPFAGGGALPLEAQRLGLESYASDLNPVAVVINKAMIEIPPRFAGRAPVGPKAQSGSQGDAFDDWEGVRGLAEDFHCFGRIALEMARERLSRFYPKVTLPARLGGGQGTVLTWLWCRTVASPNPAARGQHVPLAKSFKLSSRGDREIWIVPEVSADRQSYKFSLVEGVAPPVTSTIGGKGGYCILTDTAIPLTYIRSEGVAGHIGHRLMAAVVRTGNGKAFISASEMDAPNFSDIDVSPPRGRVLHWAGCTNVVVYGLNDFSNLFNVRQQLALICFTDIVNELRPKIENFAIKSGYIDDGVSLNDGGDGARAYADAISVYLTCSVGRAVDYWNTLTSWEPSGEFVAHAFTKHALPMIWDYGEINPLVDGGGSWSSAINWVYRVIENLPSHTEGHALQSDAAKSRLLNIGPVMVSTDPPYYDNVPYANLSDFFYLWMRQCLRCVFPNIFVTTQTPKEDELVASHSLYESMSDAMAHFTKGMSDALRNIHLESNCGVPITIYYAFKQSGAKNSGAGSSGWESFLESVLNSGFSVTGTWPMRTERSSRGRALGSNALASSIVLVCRKRSIDALTISRRDFIRELNATLPEALLDMTRGGVNSPVAPVDLSQAIIGPGMAIFSQYAAVLEADGSPMSVGTALQLINRYLSEDEFDADTLFCLAWFEGNGWAQGKYGEADVLARAKGTSVNGLAEAGVITSRAGQVQLLKWDDLPADWSPQHDARVPVWEALHQLIRALNQQGETAAGSLLAHLHDKASQIVALTYRLYTLCERQGWAEEARAYNELRAAWTAIEQAAAESGLSGTQRSLDI